MFALSLALAALALVLAVSASPFHPHSDYAVKEHHNPPSQWSRVGVPHPLQLLTLNIGLESNDFESLEQHLRQGELASVVHRK